MAEGATLADLSEEDLLASIFPFFAEQPGTLVGPGDDAAVVASSGATVVTTDTMVRGRDWLDEWSSAADVGAKVLAQNLADVAAMGAVPTSLLVTLVADPRTPARWAVDFARSLAENARAEGVGVVGGDLSSALPGTLLVSVTALGDLQGRAPVLRSGARPGDTVAVCGTLGRSAAGFLVLQGAAAPGAGATAIAQECVARHRRPLAPVPQGPAAARSGATAMIDLSDGLLRDASRVARASGVAVSLEEALLEPDVAALEPVTGRTGARECVLAGGEEHSLLAAFPLGALPEGWRAVGEIVPGAGVTVDGRPERGRGWDHFGG